MGDRGKRGGRYPLVMRHFTHDEGGEAGTPREFVPQEYGTKRHFMGSDLQEFTFSNNTWGTRQIMAHSYEEALRIAESLGFKPSNYRPQRKRKNKK